MSERIVKRNATSDVLTTTDSLLRATGLTAAYTVDGGEVVAVDDVSIDMRRGEVLGVAGESGCGKSTLGAVLSLTLRPPLFVRSGELEVDGRRLDLGPHQKPPRSWRGEVVSLLPQGAMNSLSPTVRIRDFAYDVIRAHQSGVRRDDAIERTRQRLEHLDLPRRVLDYYPHQLSGGMKQRVVTVISTLLNPRLLIADEPTSALDVSSQRVLIEMLKEMLSEEIIGGVIFITHDLPVLNIVADRIAIMYAGQIAEVGTARDIINQPRHPYSAALLSSVLVPEPAMRRTRVQGIPGAPPSLMHPPGGCRFHPRCGLVMDVCRDQAPPKVGDERRFASCWWAEQNPGQNPSQNPSRAREV
ncbi:ABC transporter ATP-binding protein [Actinopolymorpha alba]|uniref:ABC transporter ATP-binding protein n=1 Tax=Actinopolymorpha alba TaxID=533267 RepID=UPI00037A957E|nr:ABC transporter ATP-binding protein [Actinopolymorpha alba]